MTIAEIIKSIKDKLPPTIDDYNEFWNDDNKDCELTFSFNRCNYSIEISNYQYSFGIYGGIVSINFMGEDFEFPIDYVNEFDLRTDEEIEAQINEFQNAVKDNTTYHLVDLAGSICKTISQLNDSGEDTNAVVSSLIKHYLDEHY